MLRKFLRLIFPLAFLMLAVFGCGTIGSVTDRTTAALDAAIKKLQDESSNWRSALQELESKLTDSAQSTIRTEVQNTLNRAIAASGSQVRCVVDFLGDRVLEDLQQIKAKLLNGQPIARQPKLCQVVPDAVDLSLDPNRRNLIAFDGYNFDTTDGFQVFLTQRMNGGDANIDVTSALAVQTHYHMTLNLGSTGVRLDQNSRAILLKWKQQTLSTISILQPTLPTCQSQNVPFNISSRTYVPPHTRGDKEFFGKVNINVTVSVQVDNGRLMGQIYMKAEQPDDDHTTAEGTDRWDTGYVVPQGWRLDSVLGATSDSFSYFDRTWELDVFSRGGLIDRYEFIGDTPTDEAGTKTKVTVYFNTVTLRIVQTANCTP